MSRYITALKKSSLGLFLAAYWEHLLVLGLVIITSFFVLYRLGEGSLKPWDEAWYGVISRNFLKPDATWLTLEYNTKPFLDHPPLGFYLKAISMAIFGVSTFGVRLPEAILGVLSVVVVYMIGRRLSSPWAGFWGALILLSSRWFLFRARSGNLDILLLATQLLVLLGLSMLVTATQPRAPTKSKATPAENFWWSHRWVWWTWLWWSLSILAKSLISLQLAPLMALTSLYYWWHTDYKFFSKQTWMLVLGSFGGWVVPLAAWSGYQFYLYGSWYLDVLLTIGFRSGTEKKIAWPIIKLTIEYFHAAVNKWFKIMAGSVGLAVGLVAISRQRIKLLLVVLYAALVAFPYFISEKTEVWHLVPVVGAMAVLSGVAVDEAINQIALLTQWLVKKFKLSVPKLLLVNIGSLGKAIVTVVVILITVSSLKNYWPEFLEVTIYPEDYQKITSHIRHKDMVLYTTMDAYFPGVVYYADLQNAPVIYLSNDGLEAVCREHIWSNVPVQVVARFGDWMMSQTENKYVIKREGNLVLIEIAPEECTQLITKAQLKE